MLGNYRGATQLVACLVVLSSIELVTHNQYELLHRGSARSTYLHTEQHITGINAFSREYLERDSNSRPQSLTERREVMRQTKRPWGTATANVHKPKQLFKQNTTSTLYYTKSHFNAIFEYTPSFLNGIFCKRFQNRYFFCPCKISSFHGGDYEEWRLLGCYTVWLF
jgi:hypothetical protein